MYKSYTLKYSLKGIGKVKKKKVKVWKDIDEVVIAREKKLIQLKQDIHTTEALIRSLGERDFKIINDFYILERSQTKIGADLEITEDAVWKAKYVVLKKMANLLSKVEVKTL